MSRELFIRHALVEGEWHTHHRFFHDNRALLERGRGARAPGPAARHRRRRRDAVRLLRRADARRRRVGARTSTRGGRQARRDAARPADLHPTTCSSATTPTAVSAERLPARPGEQGDARPPAHLPVRARRRRPTASPSTSRSTVLNQVDADGFDWQVPGLREELVTALIRSRCPRPPAGTSCPPPTTPRPPWPTADPAVRRVDHRRARPGPEGAHRVRRRPGGVGLVARAGPPADHLPGRGPSAAGCWPRARTCARSRSSWRRRCARRWRRRPGRVERQGLAQWSFGALPETFEQRHGERVIQGFPSVVDHGDTVVGRGAADASPSATTRPGSACDGCCCSTRPRRGSGCSRCSRNAQKLALGNNPHGSVPALLDDCLACAVDSIVAERPGGTVRTPEEFEETLAAVRRGVVPRVLEVDRAGRAGAGPGPRGRARPGRR